jgi:hypothetical protein
MLAAQVLELTGTGATMLSMEDVAGIEQLGGRIKYGAVQPYASRWLNDPSRSA